MAEDGLGGRRREDHPGVDRCARLESDPLDQCGAEDQAVVEVKEIKRDRPATEVVEQRQLGLEATYLEDQLEDGDAWR